MDVLEQQFDEYTGAVDRFRESTGKLLDEPGSALHLYRVLADGSAACWRLGDYSAMLKNWGIAAADLLTALSSTEACERFRRAASLPAVDAVVMEALALESYQRDEMLRLRTELRELRRQLEERERAGN